MKKVSLLQVLVVLSVIAVIVVNGLANALPFNDLTTGEISDQFDVYFVPAGYVFSIWLLIYVGLILFAVYQVLPAQRDNVRLKRIRGYFLLSAVANIVWLFLWHYLLFFWTLIAMLVLLFSLIMIYLRLEIGRASVSPAEKWLVHVPFSVYLGWVTVATIANVTSLLDFLNWGGWGISEVAWTVIMLAAGVVISTLMSFTRRDVAYQLVILWAYIGIAIKHAQTPAVAIAAWVTAGLVVVALIAGLLLGNPRRVAT